MGRRPPVRAARGIEDRPGQGGALLLFFSLVMFFTTEIWQVFTTTGSGLYWTAIGLFGALGLLFLAVSLRGSCARPRPISTWAMCRYAGVSS